MKQGKYIISTSLFSHQHILRILTFSQYQNPKIQVNSRLSYIRLFERLYLGIQICLDVYFKKKRRRAIAEANHHPRRPSQEARPGQAPYLGQRAGDDSSPCLLFSRSFESVFVRFEPWEHTTKLMSLSMRSALT